MVALVRGCVIEPRQAADSLLPELESSSIPRRLSKSGCGRATARPASSIYYCCKGELWDGLLKLAAVSLVRDESRSRFRCILVQTPARKGCELAGAASMTTAVPG